LNDTEIQQGPKFDAYIDQQRWQTRTTQNDTKIAPIRRVSFHFTEFHFPEFQITNSWLFTRYV